MGELSRFKVVFNIIKKNKMTNIFLVFLFMIIIASIFSPYFMTAYNIKSVIRDAAFIGIVALGQACVLLLGEIDMTVGSIAALCGVVGGIFMVKIPINPGLIFVLVLFLGTFLGFLNGILVTGLKLNSLVVTIGMTGIFTGINLVVTKGQAILNIPESIYFLGKGSIFQLPMPFIIMIAVLIVVLIITKLTRLGRYMYAIGNNRETAKILGLPVTPVRLFVFSFAGMLYALAGLLMIARLGTAQPRIGSEWALNSIAAGVIGGISLVGGIGNPLGAIIGVGIIVVIQNIIVLFGVSPYLQTAVSGIVVVAAISFDSITTMVSSRKKRLSRLD